MLTIKISKIEIRAMFLFKEKANLDLINAINL